MPYLTCFVIIKQVNFLSNQSKGNDVLNWFSTEKPLIINEQQVNALRASETLTLGAFYTYRVKGEGNTIILSEPEKQESFFVNSAVPEITIYPDSQTRRVSLIKSVKLFLIGWLIVCALFEIMLFLISNFSPVFLIPPALALCGYLIMKITFLKTTKTIYTALQNTLKNK